MARAARHTPKATARTVRAPRSAAPVGPFTSDEDLGIGEEIEQPVDALAALMANPALSALIDAAVTARVAQLGLASVASPAAAPASSEAFTAFTETLKHLIDSQSQQQAGYIKPLPTDELNRRAEGKIEMFALLQDYEARGLAPMWTVGESGFVECTNMDEFNQGDRLRTFLPPVEDFIPENEPAEKVHAAMMRWLGVKTPEIGEQVKQAQMAAKLPPLITGAMQGERKGGPVELVQAATPAASAGPKRRTMGTIVPERRDVTPGARHGELVGPAFTDAA